MAVNEKYLHSEITDKILKVFYDVMNSIPFGLNTTIYKSALVIGFEKENLKLIQNTEIEIKYLEKIVGSLTADCIIENKVLISVINDNLINENHIRNLKNQLSLTELKVGLILNCDSDVQHKRVFINDKKNTDD